MASAYVVSDHNPLGDRVQAELNNARDSLRKTDDELRLLTGKSAEEIGIRPGRGRGRGGGARFSTDAPPRRDNSVIGRGSIFGGGDVGSRFNAGGIGQKRRITYGDRSQGDQDDDGGGDQVAKRPRLMSEFGRSTFGIGASDGDTRTVKPAVQSSVIMPLKDVKSRDDAITELKGNEKKEVVVRNKRMFGVLLGTLQKFKKDEEKHSIKDQERKQKEIETRLEEEKRKERAERDKKTQVLMDKRRRQEQELRRLQRKRALVAATENQIALFKRLQNFIQTNTKPPIYFMPARHTIRTIELQKKSQRKLDEIIKQKQEEMEAQLKEMEESVIPAEDDEDEDEISKNEPAQRQDSNTTEPATSIVVKKEPSPSRDVKEQPDAPAAAITIETTNGDQHGDSEQQQEQEPPKPKDLHEELKELAAGYAEELNFEDDEQQQR